MARKILNGLDLTSQKIINLADPTTGTDAANKQYVDNLLHGISWKNEVRVATTTNGALATAYENGDSIDGVTLATGDRILIKNQTTQTENGIYTVNASGAPTRATDADSTAELNNATVYVTSGTVGAGLQFTQTTANPTIGSSNIVFAQVSTGTSYTNGTGLTLTGNVFAIDPAYSGLIKRYAVNVPTTGTTVTITHNLGTLDVHVSVYEITGGIEVYPDVVIATTNTVTLTFSTTPTTNQYRCVVLA